MAIGLKLHYLQLLMQQTAAQVRSSSRQSAGNIDIVRRVSLPSNHVVSSLSVCVCSVVCVSGVFRGPGTVLVSVGCLVPVDEVVVLPAVAQLQDKLLPEVGDGTQPPVVEVDQTHTQRQPVGETADGSRLQLEGQVLVRGSGDTGHSVLGSCPEEHCRSHWEWVCDQRPFSTTGVQLHDCLSVSCCYDVSTHGGEKCVKCDEKGRVWRQI